VGDDYGLGGESDVDVEMGDAPALKRESDSSGESDSD